MSTTSLDFKNKTSGKIDKIFRPLNFFSELRMSRVTWFPGHMVKAASAIEAMVRQTQLVIEVRDSRVPLSSINPAFEEMIEVNNRQRIIIMNKADLIRKTDQTEIRRYIQEKQGSKVVFASAKWQSKRVSRLVSTDIFSNLKSPDFRHIGGLAVVVVMPNVGKSSIINLLRGNMANKTRKGKRKFGKRNLIYRSNVAKTGALPGLTRSLSPIKISREPPVYLYDSPGIMIPRIESEDIGMRLALAGIIPDKVVPTEKMVAHLLNIMTESKNLDYISELKLSDKDQNLDPEVVYNIVAKNIGRVGQNAQLDAARHILSKFRKGKFGHFMLDSYYPDNTK